MIELADRIDKIVDKEIYGTDDPDVSGTIAMMIDDTIEELEKLGHIKGDGGLLEKGTYEDDAQVLWSMLVYLFKEYMSSPPLSIYDKIQLKADNWITKAILAKLPGGLSEMLRLY
jgi:hypothetical protein